MLEATTATLEFPSTSSRDALTAVLRDGAQRMLAAAIAAEVEQWIEGRKQHVDSDGHRQVVRNGYLPEPTTQTGVGPVSVKQRSGFLFSRRVAFCVELRSSPAAKEQVRQSEPVSSAGRLPEAANRTVAAVCTGHVGPEVNVVLDHADAAVAEGHVKARCADVSPFQGLSVRFGASFPGVYTARLTEVSPLRGSGTLFEGLQSGVYSGRLERCPHCGP